MKAGLHGAYQVVEQMCSDWLLTYLTNGLVVIFMPISLLAEPTLFKL